MNEIHSRNLDLNLLRVFDALMTERSATRAGLRLGLSQSAISHGLRRLRLTLDDELFVRGAQGLQATPRAVEISSAVRDALKLLDGAVSPRGFDPATSDRRFTVFAGGYVGAVLMPGVVERILRSAPRVRLKVRDLDAPIADALDRGTADMVISSFEHIPARFHYEPLFEETAVWGVRAGHPAARNGGGYEALAHLPHLVIDAGEGADEARGGAHGLGLRRTTSWSEDYAPGGRRGKRLDGPVTVPNAYTALAIVGQTDMAALAPRRLAEVAIQRGRFHLIEPEHRPAPARFGAVMRAGEQDSGPTAWLLNIVRDVAAAI